MIVANIKMFSIINPLIRSSLKTFNFHTTAALSVKEIVVQEENKKKVIQAVLKESDRPPVLIKTENDAHACPVCRLNADIKHTDVLILSQFVRKDGCMLPRRVTGLCKLSQKRISTLVSMAHIAGLMPNLVPAYSKPNCVDRRRDWKKYNTYFHESTIRFKERPNTKRSELREKFHKEMGLQWDTEQWKNRPQVDISVKKLVMY